MRRTSMIERRHNFASMLTFCLHLHAFSEIKSLSSASVANDNML